MGLITRDYRYVEFIIHPFSLATLRGGFITAYRAVACHFLGHDDVMIELKQLQSGYQGKALHAPLSGTFHTGSLTALVGHNGSGKTTLLKTLCGILPAVAGTVTHRDKIGWLPQQSGLDHQFPVTVREVVSMGCWPKVSLLKRIRGQQQQHLDAQLAALGIAHLANTSISELSGGQFQRMLFARLLVQDASLMMLDEPFTGIDATTRAFLLQVITDLHHQGKTIICVLHDLDLVTQLFPETLRLSDGHGDWGPTAHVLSAQGGYQ